MPNPTAIETILKRRQRLSEEEEVSSMDSVLRTLEEKKNKSKKSSERRSKISNVMASTLSRHRIKTTNPLLRILLSLLSHFSTQLSELNLALAGVITALALCPYRILQGWISFSDTDRTNRDNILVLNSDGQPAVSKSGIRSQDNYAHYDTSVPINEDDDDDDRSVDFGADRESNKMTAPTYFKSFPPFFTLLRKLTINILKSMLLISF